MEASLAYLKVHVTPAARQDELLAWQGDILRVKVRAAPEKGRANRAVLRLLARSLALAPSRLHLARGAASRDKLIFIDGLSDEEVRRKLTPSSSNRNASRC